MATNKIAEANKKFSENFQLALSAITKDQWSTNRHTEAMQLYALNSLELSPGNQGVKYSLDAFMITEVREVIEDGEKFYRVHTREYVYTIYDDHKKPLYEFHWHPENFNRLTLKPGKPHKIPAPHIHIKIKAQDDRYKNLHKQHIPSGRVAFEHILQFLLEELKLKPQRKDWKTILTETRKKFDKDLTWSVDPPPIK